jgi:serine/threonine protein kinase
MSVPTSVEDLLQLVRKSGMIDERKLADFLQRRQLTGGLPDDARAAADELIRAGVLTQFQAEQFLLGKWRGFTIGKYKLLERVGVGGMGQVFLCEHLFMRKRVAVKVLPPAKAEQPAALGRFYREARAAGSLDHPNIVRTHDIDQDGNLHFIVMEYVDGPNLLDVVKKFGPLDLRRAVSYVRQVALGLDYAFRNKIVHRDIKPGNILIDRAGVARILDLGLARFLNDHTDQLTIKYDDKVVLGTADYVAPEQVANSHAVDTRADVYALGATFYFLLAGHPPFPTGTASQKLLWHRTTEPPPIRAIRPDVPEGLGAVVARMMAKDPKARYQTPAQLISDLDAWLIGPVPLPRPEEMPVLSPAATDEVESRTEPDHPPATADEAEATTAMSTSATAVLSQPRASAAQAGPVAPAQTPPPHNPGGPGRDCPWETAGTGSSVVPFPVRRPSPSVKRPTPAPVPSPAPACPPAHTPQLVPAPTAKPTPWALLAVVTAAVVATLAIIISNS